MNVNVDLKKILTEKKIMFFLSCVVIGVFSFLLINRASLSFCWSDESFYAANIHRFWQGDAFLVQDWHPTQFYTVFLYPLYSIRMLICNGDTTGVVLWWRYVSIVFDSILCILFVYVFGGKYNYYICAVISLVFLVFQKTNVYGASYNSFSVAAAFAFLIVIGIILENKSNSIFIHFIIGCIATINVVANPFLIFVFILGFIYWIICVKTTFSKISSFICGCVLVAGYVCGIILSRTSLSSLIRTIPFVLQDSQHKDKDYLRIIAKLLYSLYITFEGEIWFCLAMIIMIIIFRLCMKRIRKAELIEFGLICVIVLWNLRCVLERNTLLGFDSYHYVLLLITIYTLTCKRTKLDIVTLGLVTGYFFYGLSWAVSTAYPSIDAIIMGTIFVQIISALYIYRKLIKNNMIRLYYIVYGVFLVSCFISIFHDYTIRYQTVYRDDMLYTLTEEIEVGPAKGLFTSEEHKKDYYEIYDYVAENYSNTHGNIFVTKLCPWIYLCSPMRVGAYNTWRTPLDDERLATYYENNEDKIPDTIICLNSYIGNYVSTYDGYEEELFPNENSFEGFLYDYINDNSYKKIETSFGIIWEK